MSAALQPLFGPLNPSSDAERDRAWAMGLALQLAAQSPNHAGVSVSAFAAVARSALLVDQMRVYVNSECECVGYVIWATLTPDVESEYIAGRTRQLAGWEFSDGTSAWVLDLAVMPGLLRTILEDLRDVVFKEHEQVTYHRFKGQHLLCKRISRSDRSSFMAAGRRAAAA